MEVKLKGNPTTGYVWAVAFVDQKILIQMGEAKFEPDTKARGAGGIVTMCFKAKGLGKTSLKLIYHRPFEKEKKPAKSFEVEVEVRL
ncbi:MAG: protease inhibitor I42 family protein [Deltaproteobacteria bacterium]|jgi:predicted secreted protein|nr:protease inhibitor I42 family protein [Deltaproteobacteria bacterium]